MQQGRIRYLVETYQESFKILHATSSSGKSVEIKEVVRPDGLLLNGAPIRLAGLCSPKECRWALTY